MILTLVFAILSGQSSIFIIHKFYLSHKWKLKTWIFFSDFGHDELWWRWRHHVDEFQPRWIELISWFESWILFIRTFKWNWKTRRKIRPLNLIFNEFQEHFDQSAQDVILVERLFNSSLVVTVSQTNARKIRVYHFRKGSLILQHTYPSAVLAVKMNRSRLVVTLEGKNKNYQKINTFNRKSVYSQHQRYVNPSYNQGNAAKSERRLCSCSDRCWRYLRIFRYCIFFSQKQTNFN